MFEYENTFHNIYNQEVSNLKLLNKGFLSLTLQALGINLDSPEF